jgi:hypothetical protein
LVRDTILTSASPSDHVQTIACQNIK